jgi:5'-nucleotidase
MRILVCNDDGIDAPGLRLLADAAATLTPDVWIVAPDHKWTAASHQITFDRTLDLTRVAERMYACSGAPADCTIAAMTLLFEDMDKPDLVLSGINDKPNVGEDLAYSGTTAIAREATFWGLPAIALARVDPRIDTPADRDAIAGLLRRLWDARTSWAREGQWLGVNLPAALPAPLVEARVGRDKIGRACDIVTKTADRIRYRLRRGRSHASSAGDENAVLHTGAISISCFCWHGQVPLPEPVVSSSEADGKMPD